MPPSAVVEFAQELIRRESITPADGGCQALIAQRLRAIGFDCERMDFEDVSNLWATRTPQQSSHQPLLAFAGHTDVVPPGPLAQWDIPPFAGELRDGMLHGRGAADMKGSIAAFVAACERFVARVPNHRGALALLITSDEEGVARWGTRAVIEALEQRGRRIDWCIVGEPSSADALGDVIKVGRRGSVGATLRVRGEQGHVAYLRDNPIHRAAAAVAELAAARWDDGARPPQSRFPPTSFQVSNFNAGEGAANVIPGEAVVEFNLRHSPQTDAAQIRARVERILARCGGDYEIEWHTRGLPFETAPGALIDAVSDCVEAVTGARPTQSADGGTSDGRFIAPTGAQVVELGPINATIHQCNERVRADDLDRLSEIYERVLEHLLA